MRGGLRGHSTDGGPVDSMPLMAEWPAEPGPQAPGPVPSPWIYHLSCTLSLRSSSTGSYPLKWEPRRSTQARCSALSPWINICCLNQSVTHRQGLLAPAS